VKYGWQKYQTKSNILHLALQSPQNADFHCFMKNPETGVHFGQSDSLKQVAK
jgi:hypothetical protein